MDAPQDGFQNFKTVVIQRFVNRTILAAMILGKSSTQSPQTFFSRNGMVMLYRNHHISYRYQTIIEVKKI